MTATVATLSPVDLARERLKAGRWIQLALGVICMIMIANLQYGWTLFVTPIQNAHHWTLAAIQGAFSLFVAMETFLVPVEGYLADRFGPRVVTVGGGVLVALGWSINSVADSLAVLYVGQAVAGVGAGAVYGTCIGNALKWFPERRGLAAGITAAGFGAGSAATVIPISSMIDSVGYAPTFLYFGLGQGIVIIVLAMMLSKPDANAVAALPKPVSTVTDQRQYTWREMIKTPAFWVMYLMFVMMAAGGLFVTAALKQVAIGFHVDKVKVPFLWFAPTAVVFALFLDRIMNGITRPFFGWVSDRIGRENTMFIAFATEAIGIMLLSLLGKDPVLFVVLSGLVFFAWGEIYSLFPSTCADTYGWKFASGNAGLLYTAKGVGAQFAWIAALIAAWADWQTVFVVAAVMNAAAATLAIAVLKPMRKHMLRKA